VKAPLKVVHTIPTKPPTKSKAFSLRQRFPHVKWCVGSTPDSPCALLQLEIALGNLSGDSHHHPTFCVGAITADMLLVDLTSSSTD